jgi:hypothetical protein
MDVDWRLFGEKTGYREVNVLQTFGKCSTRSVRGPISGSCRTVLTVNDTRGNTNAEVSISRQIISIVFEGRE